MIKTITQSEFDAAYDGAHIPLTCEDHPDLRWMCKRVALSLDAVTGKYRYNGSRNIFFLHETGEECSCSVAKIYAVIGT